MSEQEELKHEVENNQEEQSDKQLQPEDEQQECPEAITETIESLQLKVNEWQDKYMRLFADFENYKKRIRQEMFDLRMSAGSDFLRDLLPVIDDFERGLSNMNQAADLDAVRQGYELIYSKLLSLLKQKGLEPMEVLDHDFDTDFHEAITMIPDPERKNKVVDVVEKGYLMRGKVLRYAKVVVGN